MGVQGLTTYVEGNRDFLHDVKFRDSPLVIDGCSLYFRLFFNHYLDQQHGGDYDAFALLIAEFLSALAACNIQPYVVLDGGIDPSGKKLPTLRQRLQSKIKEADSLCRGSRGSVLPILSRDVFIQVLIQRGIPLVQCRFEADREIACLAHHWNCPVLSNDSDFYIFDLPGGYLPLHFFQWTNLNGKASHRYISARCYTTDGLCRWFGGMNKMLLPLCAVLNGNDYGVPKDAETLLSLLDMNALGRRGGRGKGSTPRIERLLLWLSAFSSPTEALDEVASLMGGNDKLSSQLWAGMQEYWITPQSALACWFSGGRAVPGGKISGLPECLSQAAAQGLLPPLVLDAVVMHRVLLVPQVENSKLASSHCCAKALRQAVYGILLLREQDLETHDMRVKENSQGMRGGRGRGGRRGGGSGQRTQQGINVAPGSLQAQGSGTPITVEEFDRLDLNLKKNQVEARLPRTPLHLATLSQASVAARLDVFLEVLGIMESTLTPVPPHLRLAVAVTGFWLREAIPTPSQLQLQALLLGMVYGELSRNSQPRAAHHQHATPKQNWAAERNVVTGLDRQRVRPGERRGLDVGAAHSFSQWQACLWSAVCLNQLLLLPMPEPHLSWLFSGTLVHGLLRSLKGGTAAEYLLGGGSLSRQLYFSLLDAARDCSSEAHHPSFAAGRRRRGRQRGRQGRGARGTRGMYRGGRSTEELDNMFAALMNDDDDYW